MERLSGMDAFFLYVESPTQHMHVTLCAVLDPRKIPGGYDFERFRAHIASRVHLIPPFTRRLVPVPLRLHHPLWIDDPDFDLDHHVRRAALPGTGNDRRLADFVAQIAGIPLDRSRPLWEMWLVEGLPHDRWAIITKTHHAMIDGLAGNELMETVLDRDPGQVRPAPTEWRPRPLPSRLGLAAAGAGWVVRLPLEAGRAAVTAVEALRSPSDVLRSGAVRAYGLAEVGRSAASPTSVLNGPLGPHRRWGWARAELADVKAVKRAAGCTVNDVVLAAISGGFRHYLTARGETVDDVVVRSLVPVSIRTDAHKGRLGNQVTAVFADLPVGVGDPLERLAAVSRQMDHLKSSGVSVTIDSMMSAGDFVPATLMTLGARVYAKVGQRVVNTVTTNIPGPQFPLYLLGHRMLEMFPYIPVAQGVRISVGIVSYDGHLTIAATGDYDAVPDLDVLCAAIGSALAELVDAVSRPGG